MLGPSVSEERSYVVLVGNRSHHCRLDKVVGFLHCVALPVDVVSAELHRGILVFASFNCKVCVCEGYN